MRSDTEEWVFACARLPHEQVQPFTEQDMLSRLRRTLGLPNLEVEVISLSHWNVRCPLSLIRARPELTIRAHT
jgi:hypothetical protein